jgi:hypothetical protein
LTSNNVADKNTNLAITISTVDKATAKIKAINAQLDAASKPRRDLGKAFGEFADKSGMNGVIDGFKGVGAAIGDLLGKVAMIGGVAGLAVAGVIHLVDKFDDLGKKAARLGVSVDFLAEMRYAAEKTGVPLEALDAGLQAFNENLGQARAGTGRMAKFLGRVSPALALQLKGAKDNAAAFDILAGAMAKITDPAKAAALAQKTLGDSALAPMFQQGPKAIEELRKKYLGLAGSQQGASEASEKTKSAMIDMHATIDGVEASIVEGLAPALTIIVKQLADWFQGHREDVKQFAAQIGEKLPAAFNAVVDAVKGAVSWVANIVDRVGGFKTVAIAVAAVMAGPLIGAIATLGSAFVSLGIAVMASPIGLQIAAWTAAAVAFVAAIAVAAKAGRWLGEKAARSKLVSQHEQEIRDLNSEAIGKGDSAFSDANIRKMAEDQANNDLRTQHATEDAADKRAQAAIDGPIAAAGPSVADQLQASQAAMGFQNTSLAKNIAQELAAVLNGNPAKSELTVKFPNAPKGTRVTTSPSSAHDIDFNTGYQMDGV